MNKLMRIMAMATSVFMLTGSFAMAATVTDAQIQEGLKICAEYPVSLTVDGNQVTFSEKEVPPLIVNSSTLIPARATFEAMGGKVEWNNDNQTVTVTRGDTTIVITIGSDVALVNGVNRTMPNPAMIVDHDGDYFGSTMIPLRFTSEALGCGVYWDNDKRIVKVLSPEKQNEQETGTNTDKTDKPENEEPKIVTQGGITAEGYVMTPKYISPKIDISYINNIPTSKEVVTIGDNEEYDILQFNVSNVNAAGINWTGEPLVDGAKGKLVVIDIGHGGKDVGSTNGSYYEKDFNLKCGLKLNDYLRAAGVTTLMIRTNDIFYELKERPRIANDVGATILVSCHNNSNVSNAPNGTEVHYTTKVYEGDKSEKDVYGITSKDIATAVQTELVNSMGLKNRGIKDSPALAVIKRSNMPAIIIEGAFISNESDLAYMKSAAFADAYALGAAKGIVKALNAAYK